MPSTHLTDRALKALATERPQEDYWDQSLPGFGVRVTTHGHKSFVVMYRVNGSRKRRMTLGRYPALSLAEARNQAKVVLYDVARGSDPQERKQAERRAESFGDLAADYLERYAKRYKETWREDQRKLETDILPYWQDRRAKGIKRKDVVQILERIVERGSPVAANRTLALISRIFNFGVDEEIVDYNPAQRVRPPHRETARERVLTGSEIRRIWEALEEMHPVMASTFKLRLLTAQRGVEVLSMRWLDLDGEWWTISGEVTKNGLAHRVPLSPQALAVIDRLRPLTEGSEWVFASPKKPQAHIVAVRKGCLRLCEETGCHFTPHDLRRTAASHMTSMGVSRLVVSKILNHVEQGITAVYDRHSYDGEKREALLRWGGRVEELVRVP